MSNNAKNIYYTSNSFQSKYPSNSRSSFSSQIDEQEFHYIDKRNVKIGLKQITFENTYTTFKTKYGSPNMIIVQDNHEDIINPIYDQSYLGPVPPEIDIKSGLDYYILTDTNPRYFIGKRDTARSFTDVKISCDFMFRDREMTHRFERFVVHNLYFHESSLESEIELIAYLNYVYCNIEFDLETEARKELFKMDMNGKTLFKVDKHGFSTFWDKGHLGLDIFLSSDLCQLLGFTKDSLIEDQSKSLRGLLCNNFLGRTLAIVNEENELEYIPIYKPEDMMQLTGDHHVKLILDHNWDEQRYLRIPQKNMPVTDDADINKITSTNKVDMDQGKPVLIGLRSSLSKPDIFRDCLYDTQIEFFNVKDMSGGIQTFEVHHPALHNTSIEKISNAEFELIDVDTNARPLFSAGTPTFIHFHVDDKASMSTRFNLFLDSSDKLSQTYFPGNTHADFRIKLPERLEFNKSWEIALKNIFIGNDLFNIYSKSCWYSYEVIHEGTFDVNAEPEPKTFLEDGIYRSIRELCDHIQSIFVREQCPLKIGVRNKTNRVKISYEGRALTAQYPQYHSVKLRLTLSSMLANILGYVRSVEKNFKLYFRSKKVYTTSFSSNINLLVPRNFMILCDVVLESVFGSKSIRILKLLSSNFEPERELVNFNFHQDEFVDIGIKEFTSIRIQIVDTTGNLIRSNLKYPTRCQIQFKKTA